MLSSIKRTFAGPARHSIEFLLNGKRVVIPEGQEDPTISLGTYLRLDKVNLKGTKIACAEGGCGACTVIVSSYDPLTKTVKHRPVNSCMTRLGQVHGTSVVTIEALGSLENGLHPIQKSIVEHHGSQCGMCTPGFVMNMYALLLNNPHPTMEQLEHHFDGNLCRCTGYRAIIDSLRPFTVDGRVSDDDIKDICIYKTGPDVKPSENIPQSNELVDLSFKGGKHFYIPSTLDELIEVKKSNPSAPIIVGSSEIAFDIKNSGPKLDAYISAHRVKELFHLSVQNNNLVIGASTPLQDLLTFAKEHEKESQLYTQLKELLQRFASTQIRNTACVSGNIAYGGAVTDMSNFLLGNGATIYVVDAATGKERQIDMASFYKGYRKTALNSTDIIKKIHIPLLKENEHVYFFKQAHRREDDICIVSSTMRVRVSPSNIIEDIKLAYSGMTACPSRAIKTESYLKGKQFDIKTIREAMKVVYDEFPLDESSPGGRPQYRHELTQSFLFRFYNQVERARGRPFELSACDVIEHELPKFKLNSTADEKLPGKWCNGKDKNIAHSPLHHRAAAQQTTGEALYIIDSPDPPYCLHGAFVFSTIPKGKIISTDYSECLKAPGVVDVVTYKDIRGKNRVGDVVKDETVFAEDEVLYVGHIIAMVCADTEEHARDAAKLAKIQYKEEKPIITIDDAIKEESYFSIHHYLEKGKPDEKFAQCPHILEGRIDIGGQEQFYFEYQNCIVEPKEHGKLLINASTQNATFAQHEAASVCGIDMKDVDVHVKRIGGGFGGKETRGNMLSNPASVAAQKLKRPIRVQLNRNEDMSISGGRHPMSATYKVGFDDQGKIIAVKSTLYAQCGWSLDLSQAITDRALFHFDSSYNIPNLYVDCRMCKTNTQSQTAFRGFGGPQGVYMMEGIIEHISSYLKKKPEEVRVPNLYQEGNITHFNQKLTDCHTIKTWKYIEDHFDLKQKRKECDEFNRTHKYKKRGIAITPMKYGISFTFGPLNQGGALVHIYKDGTVLLNHGGVEMGQGLHTKMVQVCAQALNIPVDLIRVDETSTDKVANTSASAASSSADLNGWAVYNACQQINQRLNKYRTPERSFKEACFAAWWDKCDLTAHGFYATPEVNYNFDQHSGKPFAYFTYGAGASYVEIDTLTGDHQVLQSDIVFDIGHSLNVAVDVGQIEGAYVQGYGYLTMEELVTGDFDKNKHCKPGVLLTNGPGYYKIPGMSDLPRQFNVSLLPRGENPNGIYSSKAVGEPPLILAGAVAFALLDAIKASRKQNNVEEFFPITFPMTAENIRVSCATKYE